ncbi:hypothetical protein D3C86_1616820 [compost metagenome]
MQYPLYLQCSFYHIIKAILRRRVQVQHEEMRVLQIGQGTVPWIKINAAQIVEVSQRRFIIADEVMNIFIGRF